MWPGGSWVKGGGRRAKKPETRPAPRGPHLASQGLCTFPWRQGKVLEQFQAHKWYDQSTLANGLEGVRAISTEVTGRTLTALRYTCHRRRSESGGKAEECAQRQAAFEVWGMSTVRPILAADEMWGSSTHKWELKPWVDGHEGHRQKDKDRLDNNQYPRDDSLDISKYWL